jgi:hypothetical protein
MARNESMPLLDNPDRRVTIHAHLRPLTGPKNPIYSIDAAVAPHVVVFYLYKPGLL